MSALAFDGPAPHASTLAPQWIAALETADAVVRALPTLHAGEAVLTNDGRLFTGGPSELDRALADVRLRFHRGHLAGALPRVTP